MKLKKKYRGAFNYRQTAVVIYRAAFSKDQAWLLMCKALAKKDGVDTSVVMSLFDGTRDNYTIEAEPKCLT